MATLALGCMNFGRRTPEPEAQRILARALERGITLFDTANVYNDGESERIVGRFLAHHGRDRARIATKVGLDRHGGRPEGLSRAAIRAAIDASLARLGTDRVDIYYLHAPDRATPIRETVGAIAELAREGKIRALGVSNFASWQILEMNALCEAVGCPRPAISQVLYNLLIRQLDIEYFKFTAAHPIETTVYNPLAGGILTGRYQRGDAVVPGSRFDGNTMYQRRYWSERLLDLASAYAAVAREEGLSLTELAYAWVAGRPGVGSILVGPATVAQLDAAIDACARTLSESATKRIDAIHRDYAGTDASYAR